MRKGGPTGRVEGEGQSRDTQAGCGQVVAEACPGALGLLLLPPDLLLLLPVAAPTAPSSTFPESWSEPWSFLPNLPPPVVWSLFSQPCQY